MWLILLCPYGNKFFRFQDLPFLIYGKWFHQAWTWKTKLKFQKFQFAANNKVTLYPMLRQRNTHKGKNHFYGTKRDMDAALSVFQDSDQSLPLP